MKLALLALGVFATATLVLMLIELRAPTPVAQHDEVGRVEPTSRAALAPSSPRHATVAVRPSAGEPTYWFAGRVVDEDGTPLAGALVYLDDDEPIAADAHGGFSVEVEAGMHDVAARAGRRCVSVETFVVGPDEEEVDDYELVLAPGERLEGRVVDESDRPIADALVEAHAVTGAARAEWVAFAARTGADGTYRFDGLCAASTLLVASAPGYMSDAVLLFRDGDAQDFRLREGGVLVGTVLGYDGTPVPDGRVLIHSGEETSFVSVAKGRFESGVATRLGPVSVEIYAERGGRGQFTVTVGRGERREETFRLVEGASIRGVVVDERGRRLAGATVVGNDAVTTNADGAFALLAQNAGAHTLTARYEDENAEYHGQTEVQLGPDGRLDRVVIVATAWGQTMRGRVQNLDGTPAAAGKLWVASDPNGDGVGVGKWGTLGKDGTFVVPRLPSGRCAVRLGGFADAPDAIVDCGAQNVVLRAPRPVSISAPLDP